MARPKSSLTPRRRLVDVAIALPAIGAFLVMLPLLWPQAGKSEVQPVNTSDAMIYLFCVWAVMIAGAAALSLVLRKSDKLDA